MPGSRRLTRRFLLALLAVLFFGTAGYARYRATHPYHFRVVEPGVLYRSGMLSPDSLEGVIERYGICTVVSLNEPCDEETRYLSAETDRICAERGVRRILMPMRAKREQRPGEVERWLDIVLDPANQPVLVHCRHGVIRTGMLVAVWQIETKGMTGDEAFAAMPEYGHDLDSAVRAPIRRFVLEYQPQEVSVLAHSGSSGK